MEIAKEINDDTPLLSGKYKTLGEVKNAPLKSALHVISGMKRSEHRIYLCKWLFETHYLKRKFAGSLTNRIKNITNTYCYNHIISHCFDGRDPLDVCETIPILNEKCINIIQALHAENPFGTGIFMDYLIRRIMNEVREEKFEDTRAQTHTRLDGIIMKSDKQLWQFNEGDGVGRWAVSKEPYLNSNTINCIQNGDRFIELERNYEWLKIEYKKKVGWVRYFIHDVQLTAGVSGNNTDYIPNKWFTKIGKEDNDNHYCETGCKTKIKHECVFPHCQNMCYTKVKDTHEYETKDILKELYIVSCCHSEAFGGCPSQDKFDKIMNILEKVNTFDFISPLMKMCTSLLFNSKKILLNPVLGGKIPADCDVVIDDTLIDIKCTGGNKDISEMLQLLGYTSLLKDNPKYNMRMNNICIINLLQGECKIYNIENILDANLFEYLRLLTNNYNLNKKISININNIINIKYPLFVNLLCSIW